eukprot:m.315988 g.315988  ORF g.315988 m.315988 type:complete len:98 (+) comp15977_c0_seq1:3132-3425(+)
MAFAPEGQPCPAYAYQPSEVAVEQLLHRVLHLVWHGEQWATNYLATLGRLHLTGLREKSAGLSDGAACVSLTLNGPKGRTKNQNSRQSQSRKKLSMT